MKSFLRLCLEEAAAGKPEREKEHTFYARLTDFTQLLKATSCEHQEQWEVKVPKTDKNSAVGRIRVRKTIMRTAGINNAPEYVLTTKASDPGKSGDALSVPVPTSEAGLAVFKAIAESGMIKERFNFEIEDSKKWEVDVFYKPEYRDDPTFEVMAFGNDTVDFSMFHEWVKIDLEVSDLQAAIPQMPFKVEDLITAQHGDRTPEQEAIVCNLYDTVFKVPNQMLSQAAD